MVAGYPNRLDLSFTLLGDWVFWASPGSGSAGPLEYGRTHVSLDVEPQLVHSMPGSSDTFYAMGVTASRFFYFDSVTSRLFTLALPPQPCAATVACPAEQSCGTDGFCHAP